MLLTHCRLNSLSHTIYWKSPISILGMSSYEIYIFQEKNGYTICKQWRPWSDAAFCGIWAGSTLFTNYSFYGFPDYNGLSFSFIGKTKLYKICNNIQPLYV